MDVVTSPGPRGGKPVVPLVTAQVDGKPLAAANTASLILADAKDGMNIGAPGRDVSAPPLLEPWHRPKLPNRVQAGPWLWRDFLRATHSGLDLVALFEIAPGQPPMTLGCAFETRAGLEEALIALRSGSFAAGAPASLWSVQPVASTSALLKEGLGDTPASQMSRAHGCLRASREVYAAASGMRALLTGEEAGGDGDDEAAAAAEAAVAEEVLAACSGGGGAAGALKPWSPHLELWCGSSGADMAPGAAAAGAATSAAGSNGRRGAPAPPPPPAGAAVLSAASGAPWAALPARFQPAAATSLEPAPTRAQRHELLAALAGALGAWAGLPHPFQGELQPLVAGLLRACARLSYAGCMARAAPPPPPRAMHPSEQQPQQSELAGTLTDDGGGMDAAPASSSSARSSGQKRSRDDDSGGAALSHRPWRGTHAAAAAAASGLPPAPTRTTELSLARPAGAVAVRDDWSFLQAPGAGSGRSGGGGGMASPPTAQRPRDRAAAALQQVSRSAAAVQRAVSTAVGGAVAAHPLYPSSLPPSGCGVAGHPGLRARGRPRARGRRGGAAAAARRLGGHRRARRRRPRGVRGEEGGAEECRGRGAALC